MVTLQERVLRILFGSGFTDFRSSRLRIRIQAKKFLTAKNLLKSKNLIGIQASAGEACRPTENSSK
jgi:hypothetical protein